jgi:hypothetical protein
MWGEYVVAGTVASSRGPATSSSDTVHREAVYVAPDCLGRSRHTKRERPV